MNKKIITILLLLFVSISAVALEVPALTGPVVDLTGKIGGDSKKQLENFLIELDQKTNMQIAVLVIPSLEGEDLEDFSMQVAEKWKIGISGFDSGAILLVAINDRKLRIEVGYGLEKNLTDARCSQIIRKLIAPSFKQDNYGEGVLLGVKAMAGYALEDEALIKNAEEILEEEDGGFPNILLLVLILVIVIPSRIFKIGILFPLMLLSSIFRGKKREFFRGFISDISSSGFSGGSSFSGGGSSFSGGGGSFGGGGSSGSW